MTWTSLTFAFNSLLTSTKQTQLYDNITAQANGDSGAPKQQTAGIADGAVKQGKLSTLQATAESAGFGSREFDFVATGGSYCFGWEIRVGGTSAAGSATVHTGEQPGGSSSGLTTSFQALYSIGVVESGSFNDDVIARHRYITASPPHKLGSHDMPNFLFLKLSAAGEVLGLVCGKEPAWMYNGPGKVNPRDIVVEKGGTKILKKVIPPELEETRFTDPVNFALEKSKIKKRLVDYSFAEKNANMINVPCPFPKIRQGEKVILVAPDDKPMDFLNSLDDDDDVSIGNLLKKGFLKLDPEVINLGECPPGVSVHRVKVKRST